MRGSPFDESLGGLKIEGEDEDWDFGTGAGFYVDATKEPWAKGYKMYTYIVDELPTALFAEFPQLDANRVSITGHSMGGHGALTIVCPPPRNLSGAMALVENISHLDLSNK